MLIVKNIKSANILCSDGVRHMNDSGLGASSKGGLLAVLG